MPRRFLRNRTIHQRSVEMALSDGRRLLDRKTLDLNMLRKYRMILDVTKKVFGSREVDGKQYDGTSPSKVVGTEITRIGSLNKDEYEKKGVAAGFQLYIMVVPEKGEAETGLPSYLDEKSGEKRLVDTTNFDIGVGIKPFLESLPAGTKLMLVWQLDIDRTNDVDMKSSIVSRISKNPGFTRSRRPEQKDLHFIKPPEPVGDGGELSDKVDLLDTSVVIEREHAQGEQRIVSVSETLLFKGTKEDPVDLTAIAKGITESISSFDGSRVTLSDLQNALFVVRGEKAPSIDAVENIKFYSDVNVALLEIITRQQMQNTFDAPADILPESFGHAYAERFSFAPKDPSPLQPQSHGPEKYIIKEENPIIRLLMNPVEKRMWGRLYGFPDEKAAWNPKDDMAHEKPALSPGHFVLGEPAFTGKQAPGRKEGFPVMNPGSPQQHQRPGIPDNPTKTKAPVQKKGRSRKKGTAILDRKSGKPKQKRKQVAMPGKKTMARRRIAEKKAKKKKLSAKLKERQLHEHLAKLKGKKVHSRILSSKRQRKARKAVTKKAREQNGYRVLKEHRKMGPKAAKPKPKTGKSKPTISKTQNSKPKTRDSKQSTRSAGPKTRNTGLKTRKPATGHWQLETPMPQKARAGSSRGKRAALLSSRFS